MLNPRFDEKYAIAISFGLHFIELILSLLYRFRPGKDNDPNQERAEQKRLQRQYKKEYKVRVKKKKHHCSQRGGRFV